jgi:alkanesulfonate monooxygenase SsuD/methylene tetrahydromethanopterin reductase-like flavin-dependent oxidoreductase (luciferase family)
MRYSIFSVQDHHPSFARTVPELYRQVLEQGILADELGYDSFFAAEHHFHEYGAVPNPAIFLSALSLRTKKIRLGPAISILTFHHPLTVAENYAMVDVLSEGRLILGVGSGYLKHEFEGYDINPEEKRDRFDENLVILKKALSKQTFDHKGKYHDIKNLKINVEPIQNEIPIYVAILKKEAAYHAGKKGHHMISVPYASVDTFAEVKDLVNDHKKGFSEHHKDSPSSLFAFHAHVASSDEEAKRNAEKAFNLYVKTRLYAKEQTYDDVLKSGLALFGSVETVANKIVELHQMGIDHIMLLQNFGMMDAELVKTSMRLFMEEVKPAVEKKIRFL